MPRTSLKFLIALTGLLISAAPASAHISHESPYAERTINAATASLISNLVFGVLQLLGALYLALVFCLMSDPVNPRKTALCFLKGFGIQLGVTVVLVVCDFFIFFPLNFESTTFHINPSGAECLFFRADKVGVGLIANAIGFAIGFLLSRAFLAAVELKRDKWVIALMHALVFHPLFFPVGLVVGFMNVVYLARTVDGKLPA
jgi:hypothetical protein